MNVHVFGATSSPSCSNYAYNNVARYPTTITDSLNSNFYVDDLAKSVKGVVEAIEFPTFHLYAPEEDSTWRNSPPTQSRCSKRYLKSPSVTKLTIGKLPTDTCLGIKWDLEKDTFGFDVNFAYKTSTRRGMLSQLSSVYDPCGYVAPLLLKGRILIQSTCKTNLSWDDQIPGTLKDGWENWCMSFEALSNFQVRRCFQPADFA